MFSNKAGSESELMRLRVILVFMLAAFVFLGAVLWREQVLKAYKYTTSLDAQSMRRVRLPGARGRIYDRNGVCLADNRPSYCIAIYVEELRQSGRMSNTVNRIESVITNLAAVLDMDPQVTRDDIENHLVKRRPMEFLVWKDLGHVALSKLAESSVLLPGSDNYIPAVDIYVEPVRYYSEDKAACHVLGFVGRIGKTESGEDEAIPYNYYLPEMDGKRGVEKVMNKTLAGEAGGRLLRVDASGYRYEVTKDKLPVAGRDVVLTIDSRIQRLLLDVLDGEKGAGVILDPRNGDIVAMASSPAFDPNDTSPSISPTQWKDLTTGTKPLLNRAMSEVYPPGSIFKPVVAIAALENKKAKPATTYSCPGHYSLGKKKLHCWQRRGHGPLNMRKSIEQSCNVYYCKLGLDCGYKYIEHMAKAMGLGRKSGIELGVNGGQPEVSGLVPGNIWKKRNRGDSWRKGDTCNVSIGQGALNVTPLQMAGVASAIANGGKLYKPRIILRNPDPQGNSAPGELVNDLRWSKSTADFVRSSMRDVIQARTGTGKRAKISAFEMAGKTGTAQYGGGGKKHTWMIVFAPYESPRYAIAMLVEDGVSGGQTVAPRIKVLMEGIAAIENGST